MTAPLAAFILLFAVCLANLVATALLAWRKPEAQPADPHGLRLARAAVALVRQRNPKLAGDDLARAAVPLMHELDLDEDGKTDFTQRQCGHWCSIAVGELR